MGYDRWHSQRPLSDPIPGRPMFAGACGDLTLPYPNLNLNPYGTQPDQCPTRLLVTLVL
jgi:hypothetical protein